MNRLLLGILAGSLATTATTLIMAYALVTVVSQRPTLPSLPSLDTPTGIPSGQDARIAPEASHGAAAALDALEDWKTFGETE